MDLYDKTRRDFLKAIGAAGVTGAIAGCSAYNDSGGKEPLCSSDYSSAYLGELGGSDPDAPGLGDTHPKVFLKTEESYGESFHIYEQKGNRPMLAKPYTENATLCVRRDDSTKDDLSYAFEAAAITDRYGPIPRIDTDEDVEILSESMAYVLVHPLLWAYPWRPDIMDDEHYKVTQVTGTIHGAHGGKMQKQFEGDRLYETYDIASSVGDGWDQLIADIENLVMKNETLDLEPSDKAN